MPRGIIPSSKLCNGRYLFTILELKGLFIMSMVPANVTLPYKEFNIYKYKIQR